MIVGKPQNLKYCNEPTSVLRLAFSVHGNFDYNN